MPKLSENMKRAGASKPERGSPDAKGTSTEIPGLLERYGIITVQRPTYEWGGYRYSNAHDAIAAAKRGESA
jgi:hypothetical protein